MKSKNQLKFFIVEDDVFCSNLYGQLLNNLNYTDVTFYNNGDDCLDNLHVKPDIIFLDHNMEDITGFEVLKKIKRYDPNIYVVMVSGQEDISIAVEALKYGAFDYLVKDTNACNNITLTIDKILKIQEEIKNNKVNKGLLKFFNIF